MTARGRSINVTLIFSLTRHQQVIEAYLRGLERLIGVGGDPSAVHSVASFFVSRVDSETDRRLAELGREDLKGRLGIANARLAYRSTSTPSPATAGNASLDLGATKQRCLWASTSTKDPSYRDTLYVEELLGWETISTMPEETIEPSRTTAGSSRDWRRMSTRHVVARCALRRRRRLRRCRRQLEREGIQKFVTRSPKSSLASGPSAAPCGLAQMRPSPERDGWLPRCPSRQADGTLDDTTKGVFLCRSEPHQHPRTRPQRQGGDGSRRLWTLGRARPL